MRVCACRRISNVCFAFLLVYCMFGAGASVEISADTNKTNELLSPHRPVLPVQATKLEEYGATALHPAMINHQACAAGTTTTTTRPPPPFKRSNAEEMLSLIKWQGSMAPNGGQPAALQNINKVCGSRALSEAYVNL